MKANFEQLLVSKVGVVKLFVLLQLPLQLLVFNREVVNDSWYEVSKWS